MVTPELKKEFEEYNNAPVAIEYVYNGMDIVAFANTLTYKEHSTDEFLFISNFLFSRMMTEKDYKSANLTPDEDNVNTEIKTYYFVEADKIVWSQADKKDLKATVKSHKDDEETFKKFKGLQLDGKTIESENYLATEGSVNITLKADYLSKLSLGEHNLTAVFEDGKAMAKLAIAKTNKSSVKATNTGDNANLFIWTTSIIAAILAGIMIATHKKINK